MSFSFNSEFPEKEGELKAKATWNFDEIKKGFLTQLVNKNIISDTFSLGKQTEQCTAYHKSHDRGTE